MNKYIYIGIGICIVVGAFLFFKKDSITNYPPNSNVIVAFGDSLIFGYGATKGNDMISVLSNRLHRPIENLGLSGDTTDGGLKRIQLVLEQKPGIVIISLGGNDFLRKVDRGTTEANLSQIIEKIQAQKAVVVLLGVRDGQLFDGAEKMYSGLAKKYHTAYVPNILSGLIADSRYMFDTIHPNDVGYARIVDRIYPVMIDLVQ